MYSEHGKFNRSGYVKTSGKLMRLSDVKMGDGVKIPTGTPELDAVLGGGFTPGGVTLLVGNSGIGKSTLLMQIAGAFSADGKEVMYLSGEENETQIRERAERLNIDTYNVLLACTSTLETMETYIRDNMPKLVVVDSLQTTTSKTSKSMGGSPTQLKLCCGALTALAKELNIPIVIVGHITKAGDPSGPKTLQHIVDQVMLFEGEEGLPIRTLRTTKNRFGSTDNLGLFEMKYDGTGLFPVEDPSAFFLEGRDREQAGSVVVPVADGNKIIMAEIQTTLTQADSKAKRSITGLDAKRVQHIINLCNDKLGFGLDRLNVSINVSGHYEIKDPAADLAILLSLASAFFDHAVPDVAAAGELGIHGDIRMVPKHGQRAAEAIRLGLTQVVFAKSSQGFGSHVAACGTVFEAIDSVFFPL